MPIHSPLASPRATREVLQAYGAHTKKALGQHFLVDDATVGKIVALADIHEDETLLEIGPGIGTLTLALLSHAAGVVAVERDHDLLPILPEVVREYGSEGMADSFKLIGADALSLTQGDIAQVTAGASAGARLPFPTKLVANLPYAVAATLVLECFDSFEGIESATVMVQSEVADRMMALPGTKAYGAYTVKLALQAEAVDRFKVSRQSFMPPPHVDSAVIRLDRNSHSIDDDVRRAAAFMADAAFAQRRKTIANSVHSSLNMNRPGGAPVEDQHGDRSQEITKQEVMSFLERAEIDPRRRGESLSVPEYIHLGTTLLDENTWSFSRYF